MDPIDIAIVDALQRDARRPQQAIARQVGLSQPAVAERIKKLEQRGVITGYAAQVDADKLGKAITAFIGVVIEHPRFFEGFARRVRAIPEVLECHRVAGEFTYLLKVKTATPHSLDALLTETLRTIPGVDRTLTTIALVSLKETTVVPAGVPAEEQP